MIATAIAYDQLTPVEREKFDTILRGHKHVRKGETAAKAEKVEFLYLERELAVKRRSHYA